MPEICKVIVHLEILEFVVLGKNIPQYPAQLGDVPLPGFQFEERMTFSQSRCQFEELIK
jgi:hypothetical protein